MKLAIITGGFLPVPATKGGAVENLIVNYLNYNENKYNFDITVFSDYDEKAVEESKRYVHTNVIFIKSNIIINYLDKIMFFIAKNILKKENSHSYRFIFKRLNYLNKVSKMLKRKNYDKILLENHPTEYLALKWRKNYIKYEGKYYYHCHNEFPGIYGCEKIIDNTDKFIFVSEFRKKTVEEYFNNNIKSVVVRNGIDSKIICNKIDDEEKLKLKELYGITENKKVIIYTGRIVNGKGIKEILLALKNLKNENYKLLIVGASLNAIKTKNLYEEEVYKLAKNLKEKVIFTGFIKYEELYKYYGISDFAVLPSIIDDSAPLSVIESMMCGLPIITTDSGGIPEYANNKCAIILKRDRNLIDNLTISIDRLLNDNELREKMKIESLKASKYFTSENYCENLNDNLLK